MLQFLNQQRIRLMSHISFGKIKKHYMKKWKTIKYPINEDNKIPLMESQNILTQNISIIDNGINNVVLFAEDIQKENVRIEINGNNNKISFAETSAFLRNIYIYISREIIVRLL